MSGTYRTKVEKIAKSTSIGNEKWVAAIPEY
jgi:hypothetical protein